MGKAFPIWQSNLEILIPTVLLCPDLLEWLYFLPVAIQITDPNCFTWILLVPMSDMMQSIGSGSEGAQQSLQEVFHKGMTLKEAIKHAMTILKQVMEEKLSETNVEVATVTKENGFQLLGGDDLQTYIKDLS